MNNFYRLVLSFSLCYGVAFAGALYTLPMIPFWYAALKKPEFIPPDPVFIPLGLFGAFLLSIALYFLWSSDPSLREDTKTALYLFLFGLALSFLWFYAFFGLQSPFLALLIMIMLIAIFLSTIFLAVHVSIPAAVALVPYFIGCLVLLIVNYYLYIMNPNLPILVM